MADPVPEPADTTPAGDPVVPADKNAIDPDLVKLPRKRMTIGIITAAGLVFLCGFFIVKLLPDRAFGANGDTPAHVTVADVATGKVATESLITIDDALPVVSHAIRTNAAKGNLGLRVVPARGSAERVWLVVSGDGFEAPHVKGDTARQREGTDPKGYTGRLRRMTDMPFAIAVTDYAHEHPRVEFAALAATKTSPVKSITGETLAVGDADKVAYDVVDPAAATIVASVNDRLPDVPKWDAALAAAGIATAQTQPLLDQREIRYAIAAPDAVAATTAKLEAAKLYATRVDPVTRHALLTWHDFTTKPQPDGIDLVGLYVDRDLPADAYVLVANESPADYWYILPIMIGLAGLGLVFLWALVRAVRRDLLSPKPA